MKSRRLFPIAWNGSDGRDAKAQALFIRKYRKDMFLHAHDKLNEVCDFKKAQELLGTDVKTGLKILENENDGGENHAEHRTSDKGLR